MTICEREKDIRGEVVHSFTKFFISDIIFQETKMFFASVIKIIMVGRWFPWHPEGSGRQNFQLPAGEIFSA